MDGRSESDHGEGIARMAHSTPESTTQIWAWRDQYPLPQKFHWKYYYLLLMILLLGGCVTAGVPTVVPPTSSEPYLVKPKQTLEMIAQRYFVSPEELAKANNLSPPYRVQAGQKLNIPPYQQHTVAQGNQIGQIANLYGVDRADLIALNKLKADEPLQPGRQLKIPSNTRTALSVETPPSVSRTSLDNLGNPARESLPNVDNQKALRDVAIIKAPRKPSRLALQNTAAQLRPKAADTPETPTPSILIVQAPRRSDAMEAAQPTTSTAVDITPETTIPPTNAPAPSMVALTPSQVTANSTSMSASSMIWPVYGQVISTFGVKDSGVRNDGINIAVTMGTGVKAVADGQVVYAGDTLSKSLGNILVLRHENNVMTAYAHNQVLLVNEGQKVRQGEVIARSGQTGNVSSPQLHFQIRHGTIPVDPIDYLP